MDQIFPTLAVAQWLELPIEIRLQLKDIFQIPRSKGAHITGNRVDSDGHTYEDLKAISITKMQSFLKMPNVSDYFTLFNALVKALAEVKAIEPVISPQQRQEDLIASWKNVIDELKLEAESNSLLDEFKKLISTYGKPIPKRTAAEVEGTKTKGKKN